MQTAQAANLMTLPDGVEGASCANCMAFRVLDPETGAGFCTNPAVKQDTTARMVCGNWDSGDAHKAWEQMDGALVPPQPSQEELAMQGDMAQQEQMMAGQPDMGAGQAAMPAQEQPGGPEQQMATSDGTEVDPNRRAAGADASQPHPEGSAQQPAKKESPKKETKEKSPKTDVHVHIHGNEKKASGLPWLHGAEVLGLSILGVPTAHDVIKDRKINWRQGAELGGLGVLGVHSARELGKAILKRASHDGATMFAKRLFRK